MPNYIHIYVYLTTTGEKLSKRFLFKFWLTETRDKSAGFVQENLIKTFVTHVRVNKLFQTSALIHLFIYYYLFIIIMDMDY